MALLVTTLTDATLAAGSAGGGFEPVGGGRLPPQPAALPSEQPALAVLPPPPQPAARIATRSMHALVRFVFKVTPLKETGSKFLSVSF
ncbi:hypothetical protein GCM10027318_20730 [Massilia agilis]